MSSSTVIANMAISHLGSGKEIATLATENSEEARACRRYYEIALKETLSAIPWSFAVRIMDLSLVEEDPNSEWAFSYRYPSDALKLTKILSGIRNDTRQSRVPYRVISDDSGSLILTDEEDAQIEYVKFEDNVDRYPADFVMAFSFKLAFYVAPRVTNGDPFKMGARAGQMYDMEIKKAIARMINEQQAEELPQSEFIRTRDE